MAKLELYPFQVKGIDLIRKAYGKSRKVCFVVPCGAGKTVMAADMVKKSVKRDGKVLFLVHRKELIDQTARTFAKYGIPFGLIAAGSPMNLRLPAQIASVQTLAKRITDRTIAEMFKPNFIVCDECHHILAESYKAIVENWSKAYLLGLTATPLRMGGITLHDAFEKLVVGATVSELIEGGYLAKFRYVAPDIGFSSVGLHERRGDYVIDEIFERMNRGGIIGGIVENYEFHAAGKSAICYCVNIEHSKRIAAEFNAAGISAAHCDCQTPKAERNEIIQKFRLGKFKVLCNVELFGEGFDVPNVDVVILARPTKSLTLHVQQSMRCMRINPANPDKVALIIDHVQNYSRFGLPDAARQWSLDENPPKDAGDAPVKVCPKCHEVISLGFMTCPECGYKFEREDKTQEIAGILTASYSSDGELPQNCTIEHFLQLIEINGYKKGWAAFQALKFARSLNDCYHIAQVMGYQSYWAERSWQDLQNRKESGYNAEGMRRVRQPV